MSNFVFIRCCLLFDQKNLFAPIWNSSILAYTLTHGDKLSGFNGIQVLKYGSVILNEEQGDKLFLSHMERHSRSTFYSSLLKLKIMLPRLFICRLKISLSQSLRRHQIQVSVISLERGLSKSLENLLSNLNDHSSKSNFYFN